LVGVNHILWVVAIFVARPGRVIFAGIAKTTAAIAITICIRFIAVEPPCPSYGFWNETIYDLF
jgi:hypothetical protein